MTLYTIDAPERELLVALGWRPIAQLTDAELARARAETSRYLLLGRLLGGRWSFIFIDQFTELAREAA